MTKKTLQILLELEDISERERWELTKLFEKCIPLKYHFKSMKSRWVKSQPTPLKHCPIGCKKLAKKVQRKCKEVKHE